MQVISDILKQKEAELAQLQREIEALRTVLRLVQQKDVEVSAPEAAEPAAPARPAKAEAEQRASGNTLRQFP